MTLVIAIGNPLRQDDGVGWKIANALIGSPGLDVRKVHQLLPEMAELVSRAEQVIFVDASAKGAPGEVVRTDILPTTMIWSGSHALDPSMVLGLARRYYGNAPCAVLVTVAGSSFGFGEELSGKVQEAIAAAVEFVLSSSARAGVGAP